MLNNIIHIILFFLIKLISFLPLKILYGLSFLISFVLNRIIHYRRAVIKRNIRTSFPNWDLKQQRKIRNAFYHNFSDILVESVKLLSINSEKLHEHIKFKNSEIIKEYYSQNRSVMLIAAHYGNWEWLSGLNFNIPYHSIAVYKSLKDNYFNRQLTKIRSATKTQLVSMREVPKLLFQLEKQEKRSISLFISDQSPVWEETQYWTNFMNQNTAVYLGPEKLARKFKMAVVYLRLHKVKKGYYEAELIPVCDDASKMKEFEITKKHISLLEEDIRNKPELWLWSHNRWKLTRRRKDEEAKGIFRFEGKVKRK